MQLGIDSHIPDGLLAANALLAENSRQGFGAWSGTVHQGFGVVISHTSLGIKGSLYDGGIGSRCTGKERDTESGLDYFGARYYASNMGRWMSPDWSAKEEPVPYAKLDNPQSLNLYGYVGNNPLSRADADGHCFPWCLALAGGGVLEAEAPLAALGPVGWGVIGVTAGGLAAYATYQHFHQNASAESTPAAPAAAAAEQPRTADGKFAPKTGAEAAPGAAAEVAGLGAVGATKNTAKIPGSSRIPDGVTEDGQYAEVKSGTSIGNTKQLAEMGEAAMKATGQALIVVVTNPNAKITKQANSNPNLDIRRIPPPQ